MVKIYHKKNKKNVGFDDVLLIPVQKILLPKNHKKLIKKGYLLCGMEGKNSNYPGDIHYVIIINEKKEWNFVRP